LAPQPSSSPPRASGGSAGVVHSAEAGAELEVEANGEMMQVQDIVLPVVGSEGSVANALSEWLVDIQEGHVKWEGWGIPCNEAPLADDT
jgi:hypothetical protein